MVRGNLTVQAGVLHIDWSQSNLGFANTVSFIFTFHIACSFFQSFPATIEHPYLYIARHNSLINHKEQFFLHFMYCM